MVGGDNKREYATPHSSAKKPNDYRAGPLLRLRSPSIWRWAGIESSIETLFPSLDWWMLFKLCAVPQSGQNL